ncbi:HXXEE domain-containing protein [Bradyrhizobium sp. CCGB01]|uniref:HXXEE domain-containing protein n=1 Tax=Bradyrhizobium sp. CCGB01 TaxID=2949634 RepID=UPI0020B3B226|nr:HXXEE domain-containing protein [Bradyrhizobium sp. CCGB01]MCP3406774.1 HXXEE domain-containing protein [Bradyrhizobium sp. CCGB01]
MRFTWFDLAFPWIGLAGALVILALLFGSELLRGDPTSSRWRDLVWLSWMAVAVYLVHNVEEYGIDLLGQSHAFPAALCGNLGFPTLSDCPVLPSFFLAVNIPLFWVVGPIAALLSRRHPLVGLALYSIIFTNGLVHVLAVLLTGQPYNPGLLTAVVLFLPLSAWVAYTCFGRHGLSYRAMAFLIVWGVVLHATLAGPLMLSVRGVISDTLVVWLQILNAALLLLVTWLGERWRGGTLLRTARA